MILRDVFLLLFWFKLAFTFPISRIRTTKVYTLLTPLRAGLSPLPPGISPYSKERKGDVHASIRSKAVGAIKQGRGDGLRLLEVEFPPLLGGNRAKRQTDDYSNVEVLDANRDWTMALSITSEMTLLGADLWVVFPDDTELEMALENFPGKSYRVATHTSITGAAKLLNGSPRQAQQTRLPAAQDSLDAGVQEPFFSGEWFAAEFKKLTSSSSGDAGDSGDAGSAGTGEESRAPAAVSCPPVLSLICQPGDGGPMEDWLNVELLEPTPSDQEQGVVGSGWAQGSAMVVVNGQLDKLRDGYYNKFIFPKIAKVTDRFYRDFEPVFYLKPLLDKGFAGWLYRVYPEPWQVVLQQKQDGEAGCVVGTFEKRPTFNEAVAAMKRAGMERGRA